MAAWDEDAVRALFSEHDGDTLRAGDMPGLVAQYAHHHGAPLVAPLIEEQIRSFAHDNAHLEIRVDEFLAMLRSLYMEADSSIDTTGSSFWNETDVSPDTTLDSVSVDSPVKHRRSASSTSAAALTRSESVTTDGPSYMSSPRRRAAASPRSSGGMSSTHSEPDMQAMAARSAVIRKLARVSEQLESMQDEHQLVLQDKRALDESNTALRRQLEALHTELTRARAQQETLEAHVSSLSAQLGQLRTDRDEQQRAAHLLEMRLEQRLASQTTLEASEAERASETEALQAHVEALETQLLDWKNTCDAQRETIAQLRDSQEALALARQDAERLHDDLKASRQIQEQLQRELEDLHDVSAQLQGAALADDLHAMSVADEAESVEDEATETTLDTDWSSSPAHGADAPPRSTIPLQGADHHASSARVPSGSVSVDKDPEPFADKASDHVDVHCEAQDPAGEECLTLAPEQDLGSGSKETLADSCDGAQPSAPDGEAILVPTDTQAEGPQPDPPALAQDRAATPIERAAVQGELALSHEAPLSPATTGSEDAGDAVRTFADESGGQRETVDGEMSATEPCMDAAMTPDMAAAAFPTTAPTLVGESTQVVWTEDPPEVDLSTWQDGSDVSSSTPPTGRIFTTRTLAVHRDSDSTPAPLARSNATRPGLAWARILAAHVCLVLVSAWLGMWLYHYCLYHAMVLARSPTAMPSWMDGGPFPDDFNGPDVLYPPR